MISEGINGLLKLHQRKLRAANSEYERLKLNNFAAIEQDSLEELMQQIEVMKFEEEIYAKCLKIALKHENGG